MTTNAFPISFQARYHYVDAMQISADVEVAKGGFLSPHDVSHAAIAGWLLGQGFRDFRVVGDVRPFGIEFLDRNNNRVTAEPGDWLILSGGKLTKMSNEAFHQMYEAYDAPEAVSR